MNISQLANNKPYKHSTQLMSYMCIPGVWFLTLAYEGGWFVSISQLVHLSHFKGYIYVTNTSIKYTSQACGYHVADPKGTCIWSQFLNIYTRTCHTISKHITSLRIELPYTLHSNIQVTSVFIIYLILNIFHTKMVEL